MTGTEAANIIWAHPLEFAWGFDEGDEAMGVTFDNDPESPRSVAYDLGRSLRKGMQVA